MVDEGRKETADKGDKVPTMKVEPGYATRARDCCGRLEGAICLLCFGLPCYLPSSSVVLCLFLVVLLFHWLFMFNLCILFFLSNCFFVFSFSLFHKMCRV